MNGKPRVESKFEVNTYYNMHSENGTYRPVPMVNFSLGGCISPDEFDDDLFLEMRQGLELLIARGKKIKASGALEKINEGYAKFNEAAESWE
jgi:hypothetical protein